MRKRKAVDGANKTPITTLDAQLRESHFKLNRAFVVVSDASNAARIDDILHQCARHRSGQGFSLTAAGTGKDDTMAVFACGIVLLWITLKIC